MQPISRDYSRLLGALRAAQAVVHEYVWSEPDDLPLSALERSIDESIAQLETLSNLSNAITRIRDEVSC